MKSLLKIALLLGVLAFCSLLVLAACQRRAPAVDPGRLRVVTSLFPVYDFVRQVGGDAVSVTLLLPPGVEPHHFEPKPEDVVSLANADLFVYTSSEMEPWAEKLAGGLAKNGRPLRLEAGKGARYISAAGSDGHGHDTGKSGVRDPHIWLDIDNAKLMVERIAAELSALLPAKQSLFAANAAAYRQKLDELDLRFRAGLADCASREFIHGGHYAFAYLADRYRLRYIAAFGITTESEPSPRRVAELVAAIRSHQAPYIFSEELLAPRISETLATETGASVLKLNGLHNLTKNEFAAGADYLGLMGQNLAALRKGLACRGQ